MLDRSSCRLMFLVALLCAAAAAGQLGSPFAVSEVGTGLSQPDVAASPDGGFRVVWGKSFGSDGQTLRLRTYDAVGSPVGDSRDLAVGIRSVWTPFGPRISTLPSGESLIVWTDSGDAYGMTLSADDVITNGTFLIQPTVARLYEPRVANATATDFVVVWHEEDYFSPIPGSGYHVARPLQARHVAADGQTVGSLVELSTEGARRPEIASTPGGFAVVWGRDDTRGQVGSVALGHFASDGTIVTGDEQTLDGPIGGWNVAAGPSGELAVTLGNSIRAELGLFDAQGDPTSPFASIVPFWVETVSGVAWNESGELLVAWNEKRTFSSPRDAKTLVIGSDGAPRIEATYLDSDSTLSTSNGPKVARLADGQLIVTWRSVDEHGVEHILARRYFGPSGVFADNFESDDVGAWDCVDPGSGTCS